MTHEETWPRLPDLLDDRDEAGLLSHVGACTTCQQQLFRLNRVDRILRAAAPPQRHWTPWRVSRPVIAAVAAAAIILVAPVWRHHSRDRPPVLILRSPTGFAVGQATVSRVDAENQAVSLEVHGVTMTSGDVYVLWTRSSESSRLIQVGRFMVDGSGSCKARFTLPARSHWTSFLVTPPAHPSRVLATT